MKSKDLYKEYMNDNDDKAPDSIRNHREKLDDTLSDWEDMLLEFGWKCGYAYAVKRMKEGKEIC